jgi:hypothetical protein
MPSELGARLDGGTLRLLDRLLGRDPGDHLFELLVCLFPRLGGECPRRARLGAADVVAEGLTAFVLGADGCVIFPERACFVAKLRQRRQMPPARARA